MTEFEPTRPQESGGHKDSRSEAEKKADTVDFLKSWDWKINIPNTLEPDAAKGLDMVQELKRQYGAENVLVIRLAYDPDTDQYVDRLSGRYGVWVQKESDTPTSQS